MKNMIQNLQTLFPGRSLTRTWQALATMFSIGYVTVALIVSLNLVQPDTAVATGGCSAPSGVCTLVIDS